MRLQHELLAGLGEYAKSRLTFQRSFRSDPFLVRRTDGVPRRKLLRQLATWFEESGVDGLDWDALRDAKRQAWPAPEQAAQQARRER